jgi:hypothetical protein
MPVLISRAEFARRAGVSKPAITKACRHQLAAASVRDRIDVEHPAAAAYLAAKTGAPAPKPAPTKPTAPTPPAKSAVSKPAAPTPRRKVAPAAPPAPTSSAKPAVSEPSAPTSNAPALTAEDWLSLPRGTNEELAEYKRRIMPLVRRFGGERPFKDWLEALKNIEAILKARLDNGEKAGRLIERAFVKAHIVGALDGMSRLLLTDSPKTIASRAVTMAKSGATSEEVETMAREIISSHLVHVRDKALKLLAKARGKKGDGGDDGEGGDGL